MVCFHANRLIAITQQTLLALKNHSWRFFHRSLFHSCAVSQFNTEKHHHTCLHISYAISNLQSFLFLYHNCYFHKSFTSLILSPPARSRSRSRLCLHCAHILAVAAIKITSDLPYTCNCQISNIHIHEHPCTLRSPITTNSISCKFNMKSIFYPNIFPTTDSLSSGKKILNINEIENYPPF